MERVSSEHPRNPTLLDRGGSIDADPTVSALSQQHSYTGGSVLVMPRGNPSPKLAITVDPDVHQLVLAAAASDGVSVSAWMTEAARRELRIRDGLAAVAEWEAEHGPFTDEEMAEAHQRVAGRLDEPARRRRHT